MLKLTCGPQDSWSCRPASNQIFIAMNTQLLQLRTVVTICSMMPFAVLLLSFHYLVSHPFPTLTQFSHLSTSHSTIVIAFSVVQLTMRLGCRWIPPAMTLAGTHHQTAAQRGGEAKDKDKPLSDTQRDRSQPLSHDAYAATHIDGAAAQQPPGILSHVCVTWQAYQGVCMP